MNFDPVPITTAGPAAAISASALNLCLHMANAPPTGLAVSFRDPLLKIHFYHHPDPNDMQAPDASCESLAIFLRSPRPLIHKLQSTPRNKLLD